MECYRHPGTAATATCVACSQPICPECREDVAGHSMCHPCVADAQARLSSDQAAAVAPDLKQPSESVTESVAAAEPGMTQPWSQDASRTLVDQSSATSGGDQRPGIARRILRGTLWGPVYGQWWTAWSLFSALFWGHTSFDFKFVVVAVVLLVVYGFFGSLTGVIIGASNATLVTGTAIGVGVGLLLCLLQVLVFHDAGGLINVVFYFFTGRYVGRGITWRVQQPVRGGSPSL